MECIACGQEFADEEGFCTKHRKMTKEEKDLCREYEKANGQRKNEIITKLKDWDKE